MSEKFIKSTQEQSADADVRVKKVLIIDDDVRNIFSLTSFLERHRVDWDVE